MSTWRPAKEPGDNLPRPLSASLERVAKRIGGPRASTLRLVFSHWVDIVGETVADHVKPLSLVDGVLRVEADQPAWATEARFLGPEIVRRCEAVTGDDAVRRVEEKVGR
jgi:predicted nucleic acid-binding Zn ribbon protein